MIQLMYIPNFLLINSKTLATFASNHENFSFLSCCKFVIKSKLFTKKVKNFRQKLNAINIQPTNNMLGVIEWPYIHNEWAIEKRLNTIVDHYSILSISNTNMMSFHQGNQLCIMKFDETLGNVEIILDRPNWFIREGEIVLNVFYQDVRVVSIAFTLAKQGHEIIAYIGAIQGIHSGISSEQSLNINKHLTKMFFGLRPKTLAFESLKPLLLHFGVTRIFGISDQHRHHHHHYFGNKYKATKGSPLLRTNYDDCWLEHGGKLDINSGFYQVSIKPAIKDLNDVPSKKRAQYRRRNSFVESLNSAINNNLTQIV